MTRTSWKVKTMQEPAQASPTGSSTVEVVTLPAEIDLANDESVTTDLEKALATGATVVIADATRTTFIDTAGVRALVLFHKAAAAKDAELRVATSSPRVLRILAILKLDRLLSIYPTVAQAQPPAARPADRTPLTPNGSRHPARTL
jgi:anti-anti-sigma factor